MLGELEVPVPRRGLGAAVFERWELIFCRWRNDDSEELFKIETEVSLVLCWAGWEATGWHGREGRDGGIESEVGDLMMRAPLSIGHVRAFSDHDNRVIHRILWSILVSSLPPLLVKIFRRRRTDMETPRRDWNVTADS